MPDEAPKLQSVADLPAPPYPADVRAGGWAFDVDLARVKQSTTYRLTRRDAPQLRPWLLWLWAESWQQVPCGSLPASDEELALILETSIEWVATNRAVLLRGWIPHADGRLYHRVLTELVLQMCGKRRRDAERVHNYRKALKDKLSPEVAKSRGESRIYPNPSQPIQSQPPEKLSTADANPDPRRGESAEAYRQRLQAMREQLK